MANTKSAKKAIRVSFRKKNVNSNIKKAYRTARTDAVKAITTKSSKLKVTINKAFSEIDKAAKKGVIHKNTANRYKSRLNLLANKQSES